MGAREWATSLTQRAQVVTMLRRDLGDPLPAAVTDVPLRVSIATRDEVLEEVATLVEPPRPWHRERFASRLDRGDACFVGRVEGRLVAMNWTQYEAGEDEGMWVDLGPDEVHTLHAYTIEAFRGRNVHAVMLRAMLARSTELGYRTAYAKMRLTNRSSMKAHERLGWERSGRAIMPTVMWPGGPVITITGTSHPWRRLRRDAPPS